MTSFQTAVQVGVAAVQSRLAHALGQDVLDVLHTFGQDDAHGQLLDVAVLNGRAKRNGEGVAGALLLEHAVGGEVVAMGDSMNLERDGMIDSMNLERDG